MGAPIQINNTQNLNFGTLAQGDKAKIIRPNKNVSGNARFDITGDKNTAYTIILPVEMSITRFGGGSFPMRVSRFRSRPSEGANGNLGKKGTETLYVGATLEAVPFNQPGGAYSGSFVIEVIY